MLYNSMDFLLALMAVIGIISLAIGIVCYVFKGIGLSSIGRKNGLKTFWLAWIPGVSGWLTGSIADYYDGKVGRKDAKYRVWSLVFGVALVAISIVLMIVVSEYISEVTVLSSELKNADWAIGYIVRIYLLIFVRLQINIGASVFVFLDIYRIYSLYMPMKKKLIMFFLSLKIGYMIPFVYFSLRKDEPLEQFAVCGDMKQL